MSTSSVRVLFLGDASSAVRSVKTLAGSFTGLDRAAGLAGKAIAVGIVGGLAAAAKQALTFDRNMRNVNSLAKLGEKQFKALGKEVLALSKATGKGPADLSKALYDVVSSGFKAKDAIVVLRASAKAATAGLTDTATATKAISAALNAYHLRATDARKVSDVLFQTVNRGVLTFEELAQQMGDLVPAAAPLGISLEEVGAAIATITLQGVPAAEAATRVKNSMLALASPSKGLSALLKSNGFDSAEAAVKAKGYAGVLGLVESATHGNVTATSKLVPEMRGMLGFIGLTGKNFKTYNDNLDAMQTASKGAGATAAAFAEQGKSISVKWDRAKASLAAAAVPLGTLLFPALEKGAAAVGEFASAVENRMPQIQAQFGSIAGGIRELASATATFAGSRGGQVALASLLSGLAGARATSGIQGLIAGLKGINPVVAAAGVAFGILGGMIFADVTKVDALTAAFNRALGAVRALNGALDDQKQAHLIVQQATTSLEQSQMSLTEAQKQATAAARQYGAGSTPHKQALLNVEQAANGLAQAKLNLKRATENAEQADAKATTQTRTTRKALADHAATAEQLRQGYLRMEAGARRVAEAGGLVDKTMRADDLAAKARTVDAYAAELAALATELGATKDQAAFARDAVKALESALDALPTRKDINLYVHTFGPGSAVARIEANRGSLPNRASGGFIGGPTGAAALVQAHAGEIILNPSQQAKLGGPRFLSDLFGFGGRGTTGSFASGGIVGGGNPSQRASGKSPHRPRRGRSYRPTTAVARAALAAVARVDQAEDDLDRRYGQLSRELDITDEVFIVSTTGPDGEDVDVVDKAAVDQRLSEIGQLVTSRNQMLEHLDDEKAKLKKAIAALKAAIEQLLAAIKAEQEAAAADERRVRALEAQIGQSEAAERREQARQIPAGKKGAAARADRDANVRRLNEEQRVARDQLTRTRNSATAHRAKAGSLASTLTDLRGDRASAENTLAHGIGFDRRDVELDIRELQAERSRIAGTTVSSRGSSSNAGVGLDDSAGIVAELMRQLGVARLALGIQAVQVPIIGSFQRGTVHVPETGLAMVHAGETIGRAGIPGGGSPRGGDTHVTIVLEGDDAGIAKFIRVKAVEAWPEISREIGRSADLMRRSGAARGRWSYLGLG